MLDYQKIFDKYCKDADLEIKLSFDMPSGYETAYGTFDVETKTVFINSKKLNDAKDYEKAFYLFHELRHAAQYVQPKQFSDAVVKSSQYVIMYDGTCYKLINGEFVECKLDGAENLFENLYIGQPYEVDANEFAYEQTKKLLGDSEGLYELYKFWMPSVPVANETYEHIFAIIDKKIGE